MAKASMERWPVDLVVSKVLGSAVGDALSLYLVTGVMNKNQRDTLTERLPLQIEIRADAQRVIVSGVVTHEQLSKAYEDLLPRSKEWRGQYYVITNRFVESYLAATASR